MFCLSSHNQVSLGVITRTHASNQPRLKIWIHMFRELVNG